MSTLFRILHTPSCTHISRERIYCEHGAHAHRNGFSLIEALISVALFSIVAVMAVGTLTSLIDANRKARAQKVVTNNIYAAVEKMTRDIREGEGIQSVSGTTITYWWDHDNDKSTAPQSATYSRSCSGSVCSLTQNGIPITAPNMNISSLNFSQLNNGLTDQQSGVLVTVQGTAGSGADTTQFNIQTVVSARIQEFTDRIMTVMSVPSTQASQSGPTQSSFSSTVDVPAPGTQAKVSTATTFTSGTSITNKSGLATCPFSPEPNVLIVDFELNKGDRFALSAQDSYVEYPAGTPLTADALKCDYKDHAGFPVDASGQPLTERRVWQSYTLGGAVDGSCSAWDAARHRCPSANWIRYPSCDLNVAIPAGTYDIQLAMMDQHHCAVWSGDTCTSWITQTQNYESAKLRLYSVAPLLPTSAFVAETGFTNDIPNNAIGMITTVATNLVLPNITAVATFHPTGTNDGDLWQSVSAACARFECTSGPCFDSSAASGVSSCPSGFEPCSATSNKCKPIGARYTCCSGDERYCDTSGGAVCSGSGTTAQCRTTVAGTCSGATPQACTDTSTGTVYCIPAGATCCASKGRADLYCTPPTDQCAPDGQCFSSGGSSTETGSQDVSSQEF